MFEVSVMMTTFVTLQCVLIGSSLTCVSFSFHWMSKCRIRYLKIIFVYMLQIRMIIGGGFVGKMYLICDSRSSVGGFHIGFHVNLLANLNTACQISRFQFQHRSK